MISMINITLMIMIIAIISLIMNVIVMIEEKVLNAKGE